MTNKYAGKCKKCGGEVPAGEGNLAGKVNGRWAVAHTDCPTNGSEPVKAQTSRQTFPPTSEQQIIIDLFATGKDLVVQAGAGTGKTSTLVFTAEQAAQQGRKGIYTAFNRSIVDDSKRKFGANVECRTQHSLAHDSIKGTPFIDRLQNSSALRPQEQARILGIREPWTCKVEGQVKELAAGFLAGLAVRTVTEFCKTADPKVTAKHVPHIDAIDPVGDDGQRRSDNNRKLAKFIVPFATKAWADVTDPKGQLRYTHSHYFKAWQLGNPEIPADFILLDEAQDADPVLLDVIEKQRAHGTQIVAVGDSCQEIYEWRGAVDALAKFQAAGANVAYLTQSFRFGAEIADAANLLLGRLEAELRIRGFEKITSKVGDLSEPKAVLTRTNAGAVRWLLEALDRGLKGHLIGNTKDIIWFAESAQQLQRTGSTNHPELGIFSSWQEAQAHAASDEGQDLKLLVKLVDEFGADEIIRAVKYQVPEKDSDVVISTAHKSKGREWDTVQISGDFFAPKDGGELAPGELKLAYVAVTRAKNGLDLSKVPHFTKTKEA